MRRLVILFIIFFPLPAYAEFWNLANEATTLSRPEGIFGGGTPWPFFNSVAAENYDTGGQGVAFSMWQNPGCSAASQYRADSVNFFTPSDAGLAFRVGCVKLGDYLKYTVNIPSAGPYTISIRAAANADGGAWAVSIDNSPIATLPIPNTGSTSTFTTATTPSFNATIGNHIVKLQVATVNASGFGPDLASFQGAQVVANPAPPPGAVAAGFNTLAANYDFTQPMPAGWLGCSPDDGQTHQWYQQPNNVYPCNITQITDPVYGGMVLQLQWLPSYTPNNGQAFMQMRTVSADGTPFRVTNFPNAYYEIVYRINYSPLQNNPGFVPYHAFWTYTDAGGSGPELDFIENYGMFTSPLESAHLVDHPNGGAALQVWNESNLPGFDPTIYHKVAGRLTSDGITDVWLCGYMDGSFLGTCQHEGPTKTFNIRNNLIVWNGVGGNNISSPLNMLIKSIRVWSCANWPNTMCNTGIFNGAP